MYLVISFASTSSEVSIHAMTTDMSVAHNMYNAVLDYNFLNPQDAKVVEIVDMYEGFQSVQGHALYHHIDHYSHIRVIRTNKFDEVIP
jgi:hypothetical protein